MSGFFLDIFWIFFGLSENFNKTGASIINNRLEKTKELYHFGAFRLDANERRLWCADEAIQLTPKQFDLLFYFVENAGHTTKKSELLDAVWAETYIEETTLARNVSWLRQKLAEYSNGESFIETVPKLGYRFTAEVTRSEQDKFIIEEQIVQHIRGEETITIEESKSEPSQKTVNVPPQRFSIRQYFMPLIVVAALVIGIFAGVSIVNFNKDSNRAKLPNNSTTKSNRIAASESSIIKIGSIVHLQNRYPNDGSYLDAWGMVWSKPEFEQVRTETMFVSTHDNRNRDNGSGSWEIVSANGKNDGEPLTVGDKIHLKNMYPNAGYLDACGWVEHLPVFSKFSDQSGGIFTTKSPNRDNGTGIWIIRSATEADGTPVLEGDSIAIESSFHINDAGKNRITGFLNVAGKVKDIPAFNDYDGSKLVFAQNISYDQPILDIWTITISKEVFK